MGEPRRLPCGFAALAMAVDWLLLSLSTSIKLKYFKEKILEVILCRVRVALVHKSSIKFTVGRTLSRVGKSARGPK